MDPWFMDPWFMDPWFMDPWFMDPKPEMNINTKKTYKIIKSKVPLFNFGKGLFLPRKKLCAAQEKPRKNIQVIRKSVMNEAIRNQ